MGDGETQEVCGGEPVLVCEIMKVGADDVHGGGRRSFVDVGGKVSDPQAGHDHEEARTGNGDSGLLILSDIHLCAF